VRGSYDLCAQTRSIEGDPLARRWLIALAVPLVIPVVGLLVIFLLSSAIEVPSDQDTLLLGALRWACVLVAVLGIAVVVAVAAAGRSARRSRLQMAQLLPALMTRSQLVAAGMLLVEGALATGLGWAAVQVGLELMPVSLRVIRYLVALPPIVFLGGAYMALTVTSKMLDRWPVDVKGLTLDPTREPRLLSEVEDVARCVGAPRPDRVVASFDPRFFVVATWTQTLDGVFDGRTLHVSLSSMGLLTRDEFRAAIGHELAHFAPEEVAFSERIIPLRGLPIGLARLARWDVRARSIAIAAVLHVALDPIRGALAEMERSREFDADRAAGSAAPPLALASAITKLTRTGPAWQPTLQDFTLAAARGVATDPLLAAFASRARQIASENDRPSTDVGHPLDAVAPTAERLRALGVPSADADAEAADLAPGNAAIGLLADPNALADALEARLRPTRA